MSNFIKKQKGITLIALVITMIVLLILAGVAISMLAGENGILNQAANAKDRTDAAAGEVVEDLADLEDIINQYVDGDVVTEPVTNPYEEDDWDYAYTYDSENNQWSDMIRAGNPAEGDIIAKFYKMENKITPANLIYEGNDISFSEGSEYHMVIEGTGDMGVLGYDSSGSIACNAWLDLGFTYIQNSIISSSSIDENCFPLYVTEVIICDGITNIGQYASAMSTSLSKITISNTVTSIEPFAFKECTSLASIEIPGSVTNIGNYAFEECTGLTSVKIKKGVTSIGEYAFYKCTSLARIEIPESVTGIGEGAFYECTSLKSVDMQEGVTSIGEYAFYKCTSLARIEIPESVTGIGEGAFYECTSLKSVQIGEGITIIEEYVFQGCTSLVSIEIPESVTVIEYMAFLECTSLTDVYYAGTEGQWNSITIGVSNNYLTGATKHYNYGA